jgi:hypothetical protein
MNDEVSLRHMNAEEARSVIDKINSNMNDIRCLLLDLYEKNGWEALGYKSWRDCVKAEFHVGQAYLYRQLEAARIEKEVSPIGENPIPESQLRPLTKLEPEQQVQAWQQAVETAPNGKVTAKHVKEVVNEITGEVTQVRKTSKGGGEDVEQAETTHTLEFGPMQGTEAFCNAFEAFYQQVQNAKLEGWVNTPQKTVRKCLKMLNDLTEN